MPKSVASRYRQALLPPVLAVALSVLVIHSAWSQSFVEPTGRAGLATAEDTGPMTLPKAMALAMSSNAELAAAKRELEAMEGPVLQGGARPNPTLSALVEDTRQATRTSTLQLSQPIELGGKRAARIEAAERGREMAAAELSARQADVRASVVLSFYEVLLAQERVKLSGESVELALRASDAASKRVLAGKVSPVEETKARVAESVVRLEAAQAQSELRSSRQRLAATWGSPAPRFERAEPTSHSAADPAQVPTPQALAARLAAAPSIQRAQIEVRRRQALTAVERARQVPDIAVTLGVRREQQLGFNQAIVGLSLPLPVFDTNQGNLLEALKREDKSLDELKATEIRVQTSVFQARNQLEVFSTEAQTIRDSVLPGAQSAYDAATTGFRLGKFNFLDVLDAQRTLFQARSQYLRALGEAHRAAADIDRLLGDDAPLAVPTATESNAKSNP